MRWLSVYLKKLIIIVLPLTFCNTIQPYLFTSTRGRVHLTLFYFIDFVSEKRCSTSRSSQYPVPIYQAKNWFPFVLYVDFGENKRGEFVASKYS